MKKRDKLLAEWFWTDRYDGSSAATMNMECQGVYRSMLSRAWRNGGWLPDDYEAIRRSIRCTVEEWERCWPKVMRYWRLKGEVLVNDTQLEVYADAKAALEKTRAKARDAAKTRWGKEKAGNAQAMLKHMPKHRSSMSSSNARAMPSVSVSEQRTTTDSPEGDTCVCPPPEPTPALTTDAGKGAWNQKACGHWIRLMGPLTKAMGSRITEALKPCVRAEGWETVEPMWIEAVEEGASRGDPSTFTPETWARTFTARVNQRSAGQRRVRLEPAPEMDLAVALRFRAQIPEHAEAFAAWFQQQPSGQTQGQRYTDWARANLPDGFPAAMRMDVLREAVKLAQAQEVP